MHKTRAKYLVVDTSAFISTIPLHNIGENVITIPEVINEIKNKRQFRHLFSLTQDVQIADVFSESISFVTEFSKKTGDYTSLSATDIKLIALTYQLESQYVGTEHLRKSPVVKRLNSNINVNNKNSKPNVNNGLCLPINIEKYNKRKNRKRTKRRNKETNHNAEPMKNVEISNDEVTSSDEDINYEDCKFSIDEEDYETANEEISAESTSDSQSEGSDQVSEEDNEEEVEEEYEERYSKESDDEGWVTSSNIFELKRAADGSKVEDKSVVVGCLSTDFSIQNVLMQMGLNVVAIDGKVIKELRTYILRCHACFKTTTNMKKTFCPNCGYKTLKRVSVFVDKDGNQCMYINFKKPLSTRGKRFSLPTPQGGKHAVNPRLVEDARRPHQKPTKLARTKTDALQEDYIAGVSPFVMRDVHSRSAQHGFNKGKPVFKYWMRKNPNESKRMPKK